MHSQTNNQSKQNVNYQTFTVCLRQGLPLDNKETLRRFARGYVQNRGSKHVQNLHQIVKAKQMNLTISNILDSTSQREHEHINKTIRNLRWCSAEVLLRSDFTEEIDTFAKSKNCKNPNCSICRRTRSARIANRVEKAITDPDNEEKFKSGEFYFLTLTVKTDEVTRTHNYLPEFRNYLKKFYRSKWYKTNIRGGITSVENVITNKYHIHSHSLLFGATDIDQHNAQFEIKKIWKSITGDSHVCKFTPIYGDIRSSIMELVKYSTKTPDLKDKYKDFNELLAKWIIETKGQNFINCLGIFRGLQITGNKSKYDEKFEPKYFHDSDMAALTKTSSIKFNFSTKGKMPEHVKKKFIEKVTITKLDKETKAAEGMECWDLYEELLLNEKK